MRVPTTSTLIGDVIDNSGPVVLTFIRSYFKFLRSAQLNRRVGATPSSRYLALGKFSFVCGVGLNSQGVLTMNLLIRFPPLVRQSSSHHKREILCFGSSTLL